MNRSIGKPFSGAILVLATTMGMPSNVSAEDVGRTTATVFFGGYADGKLTSVWGSATEEWDRSHIAGLAVEHRFARFAETVDLGVEVQALRHWGDQSHGEFTGALVARWNPFPWDHIVDTSIAVGEGLSYASRVPALEVRRHKDSERLLNYLLVEAAFAPPGDPGLSFVVRVHHRSGVFGLFNGVKQGSNFLNFGLRWRV